MTSLITTHALRSHAPDHTAQAWMAEDVTL